MCRSLCENYICIVVYFKLCSWIIDRLCYLFVPSDAILYFLANTAFKCIELCPQHIFATSGILWWVLCVFCMLIFTHHMYVSTPSKLIHLCYDFDIILVCVYVCICVYIVLLMLKSVANPLQGRATWQRACDEFFMFLTDFFLNIWELTNRNVNILLFKGNISWLQISIY